MPSHLDRVRPIAITVSGVVRDCYRKYNFFKKNGPNNEVLISWYKAILWTPREVTSNSPVLRKSFEIFYFIELGVRNTDSTVVLKCVVPPNYCSTSVLRSAWKYCSTTVLQ
jgi:hypothetical protein